ncbi:MAG: LLM class flavin-dependent oxidoreductase [Thermoleophilaceae bacterium]
MKLGLNMGYWQGGPPAGALELVREADRLGLDSLWTAEAYGSDALTPLSWWGAHTERLRLGTAIMQMSARAPAATAMAAMTLDHLSGGRFVLGLGVSGPQVVEGWYGQPFPAARPHARVPAASSGRSSRERSRSSSRASTSRSPSRAAPGRARR